MAYNKVVFANETLIDLTGDTVEQSDVQVGKYYTGPDGIRRQGTSTKDSDTSDADAIASNILSGQTAYAQGNKITGNMPNKGSVTGYLSTKDGVYMIPLGYHDGGGKVGIAPAEKAKIIPANIKSGEEIMGVEGSYTGEDPVIQENKSIGAEVTDETISVTPDTGYDGIEQISIYPITYELTPNAAGGNTCTIVDGEVPTGPVIPTTRYPWNPSLSTPTKIKNVEAYDYRNNMWFNQGSSSYGANLASYMATSGDDRYILHLRFRPSDGKTVDERIPSNYTAYVAGQVGSVIIYQGDTPHGGMPADYAWWALYQDPSDSSDGWWHIKACAQDSSQYSKDFDVKLRGKD